MKRPYFVRAIILASSFLLQMNTLCFQSHGAANDDFADADIISGSTGTTSGNNSVTTKEPGEPDHADNAGGSSVWFRWTAPTSGLFSFNTAGSDFDTVLAVYTGTSVNALTPVASNDDGGLDLTSTVNFPATGGTIYYVAVDGFDGETGALVLEWLPTPVPDNDDFVDATEITGSSGDVTGSTAAATKESGEPDHAGNTGGSSVWFRWTAPTNGPYSFDTFGSAFNTLLAVYTGASVSALTPVASDDSGSAVSFPATGGTTYYVAVDGYDGETGALVLNWLLEVPPVNDDFADATQIMGVNGSVTGSNSGATKEPGEPNHAGNAGGRSVWFRWTAPASAQYSFDTAGSAFDTLLAVYTGTSVNAINLVASNDNSGFNSAVSFGATGGTTYYVAVDGFDGEAGALVLNWAPLTADAMGLTFKTLHSFTNGSDGSGTYAGLVSSGNTLYGTTVYGGSSGNGTVFKVNADGSGYTNLHSFNYTAGANPFAGLILSGNTLYGTTYWGGSAGWGTVFALNTNGTGFTNLYSFTAASGTWPIVTNSDGANPLSGLVLSGNRLYGTAVNGGGAGNGTVFSLNTNGTGFTNLHTFTATSGLDSTNNDGASPATGLILSGNRLYGTTFGGGSVGAGTVFALNTNGTGFTNLRSFDWSSDGGYPRAVVLSGNTLYGTLNGGGSSGNGMVFALNTDGTGFTTLYNFAAVSGLLYTNRHGSSPFGNLILSGDTLYGTTLGGGSSGKGALFSINTNGTGFTTLYNFTGTSGASSTNSDGAWPRAGLIASGHTLYGTADQGGSSGWGTVFSLSLPPPLLTIIPSGTNVLLKWPINAVGFTLQSTTNLVSAAVWSTVSSGPTVVNGQNTVTNPVSGPQKFYRLSQ